MVKESQDRRKQKSDIKKGVHRSIRREVIKRNKRLKRAGG